MRQSHIGYGAFLSHCEETPKLSNELGYPHHTQDFHHLHKTIHITFLSYILQEILQVTKIDGEYCFLDTNTGHTNILTFSMGNVLGN